MLHFTELHRVFLCGALGHTVQPPPTAGLPPDVLPLSGVLFSQSLMRPATPVFITAASCLDRVKGQHSLVVTKQGASTGLFPLFFLSFFNVFFLIYLERAPSAAGRAEHVAFLPHALDASYAVGDHGQVHGSGARGSGLLVLSLPRQSGGFTLANSRDGSSGQSTHMWVCLLFFNPHELLLLIMETN